MVTEYVYIKIRYGSERHIAWNIGVQIKDLGPLKMTWKINFSDENQIVFENDCIVYIREGVRIVAAEKYIPWNWQEN